MKFSITNKTKLWLILVVVIMVIGTTLLGVFGFNKSVDFDAGYEIVVDCEENFNDSELIAKNATDAYFTQNGISVSETVQKSGSGKITYKFSENPFVNLEQLKTNVQNALNDASIALEVSVKLNSIKSYPNSQVVGGIVLAVISLVVIFVYTLFAENASGALTVTGCGLLSSLLFVDMLGITRLPLRPFGGAVVAGVSVLASIISAVMVDRFNQDKKMESNVKLPNSVVADNGAKKSLLRVVFVFGFMAILSIALIVLGTSYLRLLGLEILVGSLVACGIPYVFSPIILVNTKKEKGKNVTEQEKE